MVYNVFGVYPTNKFVCIIINGTICIYIKFGIDCSTRMDLCKFFV